MTEATFSSSPSGLEQLWARLHQTMRFRAEGGTQALDSDAISRGKAEDRPPPPAGEEIRWLEGRWESCVTDDDRKAVLRDAVEVYYSHTLPKVDPRRLRGTKEWREAIALDPRSSRDVARRFGVSHTTVCNFREEFASARTEAEERSAHWSAGEEETAEQRRQTSPLEHTTANSEILDA